MKCIVRVTLGMMKASHGEMDRIVCALNRFMHKHNIKPPPSESMNGYKVQKMEMVSPFVACWSLIQPIKVVNCELKTGHCSLHRRALLQTQT